MLEIPVYSTAGAIIEKVRLDESRLGGEVNSEVLRQAVIAYEANRRVGTAKAKTRAEVHGSNRKPWRQKGTGRARAGTRKSPLWVGGGVAMGPRPRDYSQKLNRKVRRKALQSAVLGKILDGEVMILDSLQLPVPKTAEMARILKNLGIDRSFTIVFSCLDPLLWRCTRNIPGAAAAVAAELNAYGVLRKRSLMFTREGFEKFLDEKAEPAQSDEHGELPAVEVS